MEVTVRIVNAFTANNKGGNPAGVVLDADKLSSEQMQQLATIIGCSETAFVLRSSKATNRLRFFTITEEVDLCGHATIAAWSQFGLDNDKLYSQETLAGLLKIRLERNGLVFMEQTKPKFMETVDPEIVSKLLGISPNELHPSLKSQFVSTGLKDLIVPLKNKVILSKLRPDFEAMIEFGNHNDKAGLHVFSLLDGKESLAACRNFAPAVGIDEESATGTSNGALLSYLKHEGALPLQDVYRIEQGETMGKLSHIYGRFIDDQVWVGGYASLIKKETVKI